MWGLALNNGHFGPVRFITSVEIAKNHQTSTLNHNSNILESSFKEANTFYRTVAISGGEGYEEYKTTANNGISIGNGVGNFTSSALNQQNQQATAQTDLNNLNNINTSYTSSCNSPTASNSSPGTFMQSGGSFTSTNLNPLPTNNTEDSTLGKDDLISYVLAWEI